MSVLGLGVFYTKQVVVSSFVKLRNPPIITQTRLVSSTSFSIKTRNHVTEEEHEPELPRSDPLLQEQGRPRLQGEYSPGVPAITTFFFSSKNCPNHFSPRLLTSQDTGKIQQVIFFYFLKTIVILPGDYDNNTWSNFGWGQRSLSELWNKATYDVRTRGKTTVDILVYFGMEKGKSNPA